MAQAEERGWKSGGLGVSSPATSLRSSYARKGSSQPPLPGHRSGSIMPSMDPPQSDFATPGSTHPSSQRRYSPYPSSDSVPLPQLRRRHTIRAPRLRRGERRILQFTTILCLAALFHATGVYVAEQPWFKVTQDRIAFDGALSPETLDGVTQRVLGALPPSASLLEANLGALRQAIELDPRISDVQVLRQFPNRLIIRARERRPVAFLVQNNEAYPLDDDGRLQQPRPLSQVARAPLPLVTGVQPNLLMSGRVLDHRSIALIVRFLRLSRDQVPDFLTQISEIQIHRDQVSHLETLTIHLHHGTEIRLGTEDPAEILEEMQAVITELQRQGTRLEDMAYIDFSGHNRVAYMDRITALGLAMGLDVEGISSLVRRRSANTAQRPSPVSALPNAVPDDISAQAPSSPSTPNSRRTNLTAYDVLDRRRNAPVAPSTPTQRNP